MTAFDHSHDAFDDSDDDDENDDDTYMHFNKYWTITVDSQYSTKKIGDDDGLSMWIQFSYSEAQSQRHVSSVYFSRLDMLESDVSEKHKPDR